ncbi:MAG: ABC transporter ATP-binding protein [Candidatus Omnitrophota bacterium]
MSVLLSLQNLSGGYYQQEVIRQVNLEISEGDFLGIIGPNGSGKTTLLRLMSRVLIPSCGRVCFRDKDIQRMDLKELCRQAAFVAGNGNSAFGLSVWEMVLMGRIPHLRRLQFEGRKDFTIAEQMLLLTDTQDLKDKRFDELSAGERQRVSIARALAQEPQLLFLDEPTAHLDIGHQIQVLDLLSKLNGHNNLTVVMVLHDLNLASNYCRNLVLLDKGRVFKQGSPQEVLTYQNIEAVYKTVVLVNENPVTRRPNVILVPGEKT